MTNPAIRSGLSVVKATIRPHGELETSLALTVGLMRIGAVKVALPVSSIREVVHGASTYADLPITAEGLRGAINVRGTVVPVVDLRTILRLASDEDDNHVVVILRHDGFLLGLRVDAVFGLVKLQRGDICDLAAAGPSSDDMLATHAFDSGDGIVTILDPSRIFDRPGLPKVAEKIERRELAVEAKASVLLFACGRSHLGIDVECIDATVPNMAIQRGWMATGFCLGTIEHRGYNVPVIDTTAAIGLGAGTRASTSNVIVIRFGEARMLALAVDAVRDIVPIYPKDILAMPALRHEYASLFGGMFVGKQEPHHLLLDLDGLRRHPELIDLAELCRPKPRLSRDDANTIGRSTTYERGEPYITYRAGGEVATLVKQIKEVLPFPKDVSPFLGTAEIRGLFMHRGRLMPLICLEHVLLGCSREVDEGTARVLFVEAGDRSAGFLVESLLSIDTANLDPDQCPATVDGRQTSLMGRPFVMLGPQRRMVSKIDLLAQIEYLFGVAIAHGYIAPGAMVQSDEVVFRQASA